MKKQTKTIIRTVLLVFVALIVGINVYAFNASRVAGDAIPMPFGVGLTVVLSGSMEPELSVGDLLVVVRQDSYAIDEVVVFQEGRIGVVHRIIEMDGTTVTTQGDANNAPDEPMDISRVKGKVVLAIPLIGHVVNMIKTPVATVVILAAAIFLLERSFHKEKEKDADQLEEIKREIERLKQASNGQTSETSQSSEQIENRDDPNE
ncbi:MAG: signal peptidase I [Clostridia bacterium]|nr:signal peptidase I [Clostridia bacterium]